MYLHITDDRTGEVLHTAALSDDTILDCEQLLADYLQREGGYQTIAPDSGYVPFGCADVSVVLGENQDPHHVVCFACQSFFLDSTDY